MTPEELKRIQNYRDKIYASQANIAVVEILEADERKDLSDLLHKWQEENESPEENA